jgi:hypothetical protein
MTLSNYHRFLLRVTPKGFPGYRCAMFPDGAESIAHMSPPSRTPLICRSFVAALMLRSWIHLRMSRGSHG